MLLTRPDGEDGRGDSATRQLGNELIDRFIDAGSVSIGYTLAEPVPPTVMALLLGLPASDAPWFREQTHAYLHHAAQGDVATASVALKSLQAHLSEQLADRPLNPRDDMLSNLVALRFDGEPISAVDVMSLSFLLLAAGHETTIGAIGGMLFHVPGSPEIRDALRSDPALTPAAVEESLRLEPSLIGLVARSRSKQQCAV